MNERRYPQLAVSRPALRHNIETLRGMVTPFGADITAVCKGFSSIPEACEALHRGGARAIASSRIDQLKRLKERYPGIVTELIRIPMLSEAEDVVRFADISLASQIESLKRLNDKAEELGKVHKVILMKDIGDLREGFWSEEDMQEAALRVERDMPGLFLYGTGANFNCYGSVCATTEKLRWLVDITERIEEAIGRRLDIISTGGTANIELLLSGGVPSRVNDLRMGISLITKAEYAWAADFEGRKDGFRLRAEIVELREKPTMPQGEHGFAALNDVRKYVDLGIRKRAIVALGKQDFGSSEENIRPVDPRIRIWGSSSDHTMLDVHDCGDDYAAGDIVEFRVNYPAVMYASMSPNVRVNIMEEEFRS